MPLVTRQSDSGNLFKQASLPNWSNGDLWVDTDDSSLHVNQAGTDVKIALGSLTASDILYASADDTINRLAKGTAGQALKMNSGATAPEWGSVGGGLLCHTPTDTGFTNIAGAARYVGLLSYLIVTATETDADHAAPLAGTLSNLFVNIITNTSTNATTVKLRKNAADATQTFSIGAGLTGLFKDVTNSDTVAAADLITVQTSGSNAALAYNWVGVIFRV